MSDFHDIGDHYDSGGSYHDVGSHHGGGQGHNLLGHFLGLDKQAHAGEGGEHSHHNHAGSTNPAHVQTTDTFQGSKWSQFFAGLPVTPTMLFTILFGGLTVWLGVVYMVSHMDHSDDTMAKSIHAPSVTADKLLLSGTRLAIPVHPQGESTSLAMAPGAIQAAPLERNQAPVVYTIDPYRAPLASSAPTTSYHVPIQTADGLRVKTIVNR